MLPGAGRLRILGDYLRTSLWFVPVMMMGAAIPLVAVVLAIDTHIAGLAHEKMPFFIYFGDSTDARGVLSSLFTSMVTMVSLVFSITMVVLTLAAGQFGPRLVRNFMASPQTQLVLGLFVMTIVYCLCVMAAIGWRGGEEALPHVTVSVAIALVLISVVLLVLYLHGLARSIMSETVIERVSREFDELIEDFELSAAPSGRREDGADILPENFEKDAAYFGPAKAGYVQAINLDEIVRVAAASSVIVGLEFRAGDFVSEGGRSIAVYPGQRLDKEGEEKIRQAVATGTLRTPVQDPAFPLRHMAEIAVRALSPGVNDPYTATAVIDQLSASLSRVTGRLLPPGVLRDDKGAARVVMPAPTYESLLVTSFDQIRQSGGDKPIVLLHLLEAVGRIAIYAQTGEQRQALREQLRLVEEAARRRIEDPRDRKDVLSRAARVKRRMNA